MSYDVAALRADFPSLRPGLAPCYEDRDVERVLEGLASFLRS